MSAWLSRSRVGKTFVCVATLLTVATGSATAWACGRSAGHGRPDRPTTGPVDSPVASLNSCQGKPLHGAVKVGDCVIVSGDGFKGNEAVNGRLLSSPTQLSRLSADAQGRVNWRFTVVAAGNEVATLVGQGAVQARGAIPGGAVTGNVTAAVPRFAYARFRVAGHDSHGVPSPDHPAPPADRGNQSSDSSSHASSAASRAAMTVLSSASKSATFS